MPKVTIRPTKQSPNYKRIAVTGAGGVAATAVSDESDATYVRRKADKAPLARFLLAALTVPAGSTSRPSCPARASKQPTSRPEARHPRDVRAEPRQAQEQDRPDGQRTRGPCRLEHEPLHLLNAGRRRGDRRPTGPWAGLLSVLAVRVNDGHKAADANRATMRGLCRRLLLRAPERASSRSARPRR